MHCFFWDTEILLLFITGWPPRITRVKFGSSSVIMWRLRYAGYFYLPSMCYMQGFVFHPSGVCANVNLPWVKPQHKFTDRKCIKVQYVIYVFIIGYVILSFFFFFRWFGWTCVLHFKHSWGPTKLPARLVSWFYYILDLFKMMPLHLNLFTL